MDGAKRLAAIDVGTVTTRLLVADVGADGISEVARSTDITHLGEGLGATGSLSAVAIERAAGVLGGYARTMADLGVERYRAIATSASRDAENGPEFRALAEARGVTLEIVPGAREAELSFLGTTYELRGEGQLVVDCGGGSTELVLGDVSGERHERVARVGAARSIDVGSRRMTERFLLRIPPARTSWMRRVSGRRPSSGCSSSAPTSGLAA